ncbi:class I SAM-dependent methyltransferase [Chryseotalea sanaruensis]|uniref:Class I SAM-dependent methyltransferase n=1 Tax=Chryseotalea sanaruensis TaxID=2482724 RepID=A0A401U837_9BACT|nr:class I SAM-dependent methyltransferase [Chryseotalea sanaruensis]GCC51054.1 class I SAM-dependent methyltransferase [Chryseotalea sanaruensis]
MLATSPRPKDEELSRYYESTDYVSHTAKGNSLVNSIYLIARSFTLKGKRKLAQKLVPQKGNLLDIGCGTGDFLQSCLNDNWQCTGVEPGTQPRELADAKGIRTFERLDQIKEKYQLITMWHVLEHVPNLNETLSSIYNLLDQSGTLLIAVPNHLSYDARLYKKYWAGYDVPRHLWHFNQQTMERILRNNNFELKQILPMKLDSFYVSLLSEGYKGMGIIRYIKALAIGLFSNLFAKNNKQYSSLIYIFKK